MQPKQIDYLPLVQVRSKLYFSIAGRLSRWKDGQDSHFVDLLRGASLAGFLKGISAILSFGLSVVLGRVLGADAAGVYFLALSTVMIASTIGRVGLDSVVLRIIANHASANRWSDVRSVHRSAITIGLICSILVAVTLFFASDFLAHAVFSDSFLTTPIRIMTVAVVPLSLGVLISRALNGLSRIRDSILVFSVVPYGVALVVTWILAYGWGVNGAIVAYVVAVTAAMIYGWTAWRRALAGHFSTNPSRQIATRTKELLNSGAPLLMGALLQLVMQMSGTIMLGMWAENADVGQFAVAWRTAALITFILLAVNAIAQPKFAELYSRGDKESLATTAQKATLLMTACATPVFLVFLVAPEIVMSVFGSDFVGGAATLRIVSVGQFVNVAAGSVGVLLVMSGHERDYRNVQVVAACVVLVLNVMLIPTHGATGAAIAVASALVVQNILFGYYVWTRLAILVFNPRSLIKRSFDRS